jgi:hypothetical protein
MTSSFNRLRDFIQKRMRMSHIYQPVMIQELLQGGGRSSIRKIAGAFLARDESQLEYYEQITKIMPGKVLSSHGIVVRDGDEYCLTTDSSSLSLAERDELVRLCDEAIRTYLEKRGRAIYDHRRAALGYISGSLRYEVLKRAGFRCELCGVSADERAIEVDHIVPRKHGGEDDLTNLQALCFKCNANKGARDKFDFRVAELLLRINGAIWPSPLSKSLVLLNPDTSPGPTNTIQWLMGLFSCTHLTRKFEMATYDDNASPHSELPGPIQTRVKVFAFPLLKPIGKADAGSVPTPNQPVITAFFLPFGDDYRGGVSLATGWLAGPLGGARRIVVSKLADSGSVKIFSSGSALDGGPSLYLQSPEHHGHGAQFREIASFEPFGGSGGVRVATTSTTTGANLLISGAAPGGTDASVIKYDFVRPNAQSTTLEAVRLGQVWSGKASAPPTLGGD